MHRSIVFAAAAVLALIAGQVRAGISASATISPEQLAPNSYQYSLTLTNTGTTPIETFWFAWIPAYDLLPSNPTSFSSPSGWTGKNAPDSFGVASAQWVTTQNPLEPGHSLSGFVFDSPDSPSVINGTSAFFGLPVKQSYVYIGAPETDPGFALVPTTVTPEPSALGLLLIPAGLIFRRQRRQLV